MVSISYAQQDSSFIAKENIFRRVGNDGKLTIQTIAHTYGRPFKWKRKNWLQFGGALAISGAVMLVDEPISEFFQRNQTKTLDRVANFGDFMGQPEHNYPFMLTVWGTGVVTKNEWLRDTGIMLFASVTTSGILQTISKDLVGRARPISGKGAYAFNPIQGGSGYHSFPSGHTMLALASSWVMAKQVKPIPLKVAFYSIPLIVGTSRIYDQAHWTSDVLLGSALGIACAETVVRVYPKFKKQLKENQKGWILLPSTQGLSFRYRF